MHDLLSGEGGLSGHEKSRFELEMAPFQRRGLSVGEVIHATSDLQFSVGRVSELDGDKVTVDWESLSGLEPMAVRGC